MRIPALVLFILVVVYLVTAGFCDFATANRAVVALAVIAVIGGMAIGLVIQIVHSIVRFFLEGPDGFVRAWQGR